MSLQRELGFPNQLASVSHEAVLAIMYTAQLFSKEAYALLRPFGMTDSQFNVLTMLMYQSPPEGLTQTDLSHMMLVNRSNVTGLLDRMEESGWVVREEDAEDRRIKRVRLTKKGKEAALPAEEAYMKRVEEVMSALSDDETLCLLDLLEGLWRPIRNSEADS
ncbi:MarR family transcriptional regulator [bacterium]|nr:MarR family transcriptional regulator [bacterium]